MKFFISIGMFFAIVLCILEAIWIRRAICVMIIPISMLTIDIFYCAEKADLTIFILYISKFYFIEAKAVQIFFGSEKYLGNEKGGEWYISTNTICT